MLLPAQLPSRRRRLQCLAHPSPAHFCPHPAAHRYATGWAFAFGDPQLDAGTNSYPWSGNPFIGHTYFFQAGLARTSYALWFFQAGFGGGKQSALGGQPQAASCCTWKLRPSPLLMAPCFPNRPRAHHRSSHLRPPARQLCRGQWLSAASLSATWRTTSCSCRLSTRSWRTGEPCAAAPSLMHALQTCAGAARATAPSGTLQQQLLPTLPSFAGCGRPGAG